MLEPMKESRATDEGHKEPRREFFKSVGRNLILGLTGAGVAVMIRNGQIVCINELAPCTHCSLLKNGCELPKAVSYRSGSGSGSGRKQESHDKS
jgi:hypothetical protein